MVEFSKNKWKYTSIGLATFLAVMIALPSASAATVKEVITKVLVTNGPQDPVPTIEQQKSKLYDFTADPISIPSGWGGSTFVNFGTGIDSFAGPGTIVDLSDYDQACIAISIIGDGLVLNRAEVLMGIFTTDMLIGIPYELPANEGTVCFDIAGPELLVNIIGDPNTDGDFIMYLMLKS